MIPHIVVNVKIMLYSLLIIGVCGLTFVCADIKATFIQHAMECNKQYPISMEEFDALQQHKATSSKNSKCLQACVFKKMNWMNNDGMFDVDAAYKMTEKQQTDTAKLKNAKVLYNECKKVNDATFTEGDKDCERAAVLTKCLTEESIKLGF